MVAGFPMGRCRRAPPLICGAWERSFSATTFINAGNVTHTPAYGHLIALGVETTVRAYGKFPRRSRTPTEYRSRSPPPGDF